MAGLRRNRSEEHTSELQSPCKIVCRLLLGKKQSQSRKGGPLFLSPSHTPTQKTSAFTPRAQPIVARRWSRSGKGCSAASGPSRFFNDTATTEIYTLSLHDALPIYAQSTAARQRRDEHGAFAGIARPVSG